MRSLTASEVAKCIGADLPSEASAIAAMTSTSIPLFVCYLRELEHGFSSLGASGFSGSSRDLPRQGFLGTICIFVFCIVIVYCKLVTETIVAGFGLS